MYENIYRIMDPEKLFLKHELEQYLVRLIRDLPPLENQVLVLHHFEFFTKSEISKILNVPLFRVAYFENKAIFRLVAGMRKQYGTTFSMSELLY